MTKTKTWLVTLPPSAGDPSRFGEIVRTRPTGWTDVRVTEDRLDEVFAVGGAVY